MKTGVVASKLAVAAFVVPYVFVYAPVLLMVKATPVEIFITAIAAIVGMWGLGMAMIGHWYTDIHWAVRIVAFGAGLMLIDPGLLTDAIGAAILVGIYFLQRRKLRKQQEGTA